MSNLNTDYLSELDACWDEYNKALADCSKQLRVAQVHSWLARDKAVEASYYATTAIEELNSALECELLFWLKIQQEYIDH